MFFQSMFKKKDFKNNKKYKLGLNDWMELTKEERKEIDMKEKDESMRKKKALLKYIREEYIKIKKQKKINKS